MDSAGAYATRARTTPLPVPRPTVQRLPSARTDPAPLQRRACLPPAGARWRAASCDASLLPASHPCSPPLPPPTAREATGPARRVCHASHLARYFCVTSPEVARYFRVARYFPFALLHQRLRVSSRAKKWVYYSKMM